MPQNLDGSAIASQVLKPFKNSQYNSDKLLDQQIETHYYINPALNAEIRKNFANPEYLHISTLMADYFYRTYQQKVFVFTASERMHILIANKDGLRFYNSYKFVSPEDFLYWLMVVLDLHHLDPAIVPVLLGGRIGKVGQITDLLNNYLGDVNFVEPYNWQLPPEVEKHMYIELYMAQTCA